MTKQISFRAVQNREQGDRATDVIKAVKKRRGMSQIRNAPSLKFSLCEHDNAVHRKASSKDNFTKIRIKQQDKHPDIISGVDRDLSRMKKVAIVSASKMKETYYDMLINQPKAFNRKKGSLVTPDALNRLNLHQKFRCLVPTDFQVNPVRESEMSSKKLAMESTSRSSTSGSPINRQKRMTFDERMQT